jgi:predicted DNA-binding transcriptional regulator AlpA
MDSKTTRNRILKFKQWCTDNGFSESTGHRLRRTGKGPQFIRISDRMLGVTEAENERWRQSRATT